MSGVSARRCLPSDARPAAAHLSDESAQVLLAEGVRVAVIHVERLLDGLSVQPVGELIRLGGLLPQPVQLQPFQLVKPGPDRRVGHVQLVSHGPRLSAGEGRGHRLSDRGHIYAVKPSTEWS